MQRSDNGTDKVAGASDVRDSGSARSQTYLKLFISGKWRKCLLDTGSDVTLLPTSVVAGMQLESTARKITAANGTAIKVLGTATVSASSGQHHMRISGLVSSHVGEIMLGIGFLKEHDAVWNFRVGEVVLAGYRHKLCSRDRQPWYRRVILQDETTIPAGSELDITTLTQYSDFNEQFAGKSPWATETREIAPGVRVSRTIVPDRSEDIPVRVVNLTKSAVKIHKVSASVARMRTRRRIKVRKTQCCATW